MTARPERVYDALVVGAGTAGLLAALRLAQEGADVLVAAKGVGATHLTGGTVDVLGYTPERVANPAAALPGFIRDHPGHPYARVGVQAVGHALEWVKAQVAGGALVGSLEANFLLPTAVGVPKPSALVPDTMARGDLRNGGRFTIVGLSSLKDFYPAYLADNLNRAGRVEARAITISPPTGGEADVNPMGWARRFEDPEFRKAVIAELEPSLDGGAVGFPAVLGLDSARMVWQELGDTLGVPVFEIPTLPPSIPGNRMARALRAALTRAGGRVVMGGRVIGVRAAGKRMEEVVVDAAARPKTYRARHFVLATGGFASRGLEMDSFGTVRDTAFGLPVAGMPADADARWADEYLADHPAARVGIGVDDELRPLDSGRETVYDNVRVAGAALAGAEPWREKSGEGISLATGLRAAELILGQREA
ncbi:MAG: glycerol-3-phosphate dehydrogenase subunit GlpB [Actinomycetota bacterium]|nr:glycerol-3-phosphate dehydrogenase subunit GlpB [Actinomycetota bacterium]